MSGVTAKREAVVELRADPSAVGPGVKEADRQMRAYERDRARATRDAERDARRAAKEQARAEREAARDRVRVERDASRAIERERNKAAQAAIRAEREVAREAQKAARAKERAEKDAAKKRKEYWRDIMGTGGSLGGKALGIAGLALGVGAVGGLASMASDVLSYEKTLTRLQITAESTPEAMRAFSGSIDEASRNTGINRNEILGAASAYVALTGDMNTARSSTATWAKVAAATGSTTEDIARAAAGLSQQMGIGPAEMEATFSVLAKQGKMGAIELRDLAGNLSQIAPLWAQFKGGKGFSGVRELGATLQIVKRGFGGDAGETVTGLQSLLVSLQKNAGRFAEAGVKVFDVDKNGKETMKDVFSIIDAISKSDLAKHPDLMEKAFGRIEAYRAYLQIKDNRRALDEFISKANDAGMIQRDFDTYMNSTAGRLEVAWNSVKLAVANAFTPERVQEMVRAIEALTRSMPALMRAIGGVLDLFNAFVHTVARAKHWAQGNSHYKLSTDEKDQLASLALERRGGKVAWTPESKKAALATEQRVKEYNGTMDDLMATEDDFGATEASLRKAMMLSVTGGTQAKDAARSYLDDRLNNEATQQMYWRIKRSDPWFQAQGGGPDANGVQDKITSLMARFGTAPVGPRDPRRMMSGIAGLFGVSSTSPKGKPLDEKALAKAIGKEVAEALRAVPFGVAIGADHVANAAKNAPSLGTRPGGRR